MTAPTLPDTTVKQLVPAFESDAARWFMGQLFSVPRLAHHPPCRCFDNHVLRIGRFVLCLGCTCVTCGASVTALALAWLCMARFAAVRDFGTLGFVLAGLGFFFPTIIQPFWQWKPFKMLARFMLGVSIVLLWFGAMFLLPVSIAGILLRVIFLFVFVAVFRATQWLRIRAAHDPCHACEGMAYPLCRDHRRRLGPLLAQLQRKARPEDAPFVAFAQALAAEDGADTSIEILTLSDFAPAVRGTGPCFHGSMKSSR